MASKMPSAEEYTRRESRFNLSVQSAQTGQVGRAMEGAGRTGLAVADEVHRVFLNEKKKTDQALVDDALNELKAFTIDLEHGEDGFKIKKGKDAIDKEFRSGYTGRYKSKQDELYSKLRNGDQQELFKKHADELGIRVESSIVGHSVKESEALSAAAFTGRLSVNKQATFANWDNLTELAKINKDSFDAIANRAEEQGWTQDMIEVAKDEYLQGVHDGVLNQAIENESFEFAQKYLDANKDDLTADQKVSFQDALDNRKSKTWARTKADEIRQKNKGDYAAQMAEVEKIKDVSDRAETEALIKAGKNSDEVILSDKIRETKSNSLKGIDSALTYQDGDKFVEAARKVDGTLGSEMKKYLDAKFLGGAKHTDMAQKITAMQLVDGANDPSIVVYDSSGRFAQPLDPEAIEQDIRLRFGGVLKETDLEDVIKYAQEGGQLGGLTASRVGNILAIYSKHDKKDDAFKKEVSAMFNIVKRNLEPGKQITDAVIEDIVKKAVTSGETIGEGGFWGYGGLGKDETMLQAEVEGRADKWVPDEFSESIEEVRAEAMERNKLIDAHNDAARKYNAENPNMKPYPIYDFINPTDELSLRLFWKQTRKGIK